MTIEELRNRLAEIEARMEELAGEDFNMSDEEAREFDNLKEEHDKLKKKLERMQSFNNVRSFNTQSQNTPIRPDVGSGEEGEGGEGRGNMPPGMGEDGEFRNLGDFLHHARFDPQDSRIKELRDMAMEDGASGGILVPEKFSSEILKVNPEQAIVRPRATVIPAGTNPDAAINFPAMQQGSKGVYGGVNFNWTAEQEEKPESETPKLRNVKLEPNEASGWVGVSNKLLRNSEAASQFLMNTLRDAKIGFEDYHFLRGDGNSKPLGIINSPGAKVIDRNTSAEILYEDVINMEASVYPESQSNLLWVASQSAFNDIKDMKDSEGKRIYTDGNLVKGIPSMLDGIPLKWTGRVPTLGNKGDLMLLDLRYYMIKDGSGLYIAASEHAAFKKNKTLIKIVFNVDGQSWLEEPLTLEDEDTKVSPLVILN